MSYQININEMLTGEPKFSIFVEALTMTELINKLKERGPFTVMAPSNLAFMKLPETKLIELMKPINKANLAEVMKYHIIDGKISETNIRRRTDGI